MGKETAQLVASVTVFLIIGLVSALIVSGEWFIVIGAVIGWVVGILFIRSLN